MDSINNMWDSGTTGKRLILGGSLTVAACGCLMIAFAAWSFLGGGRAAAPEPTPALTTPTLAPGVLPTVDASTPLVTPTAGIAPTLDPALMTGTPTTGATPAGGAPCDCNAERIRCKDFETAPEQAQACFDYCTQLGVGDVSRLDQNDNGIACDSSAPTP